MSENFGYKLGKLFSRKLPNSAKKVINNGLDILEESINSQAQVTKSEKGIINTAVSNIVNDLKKADEEMLEQMMMHKHKG
ncbi:hypothetical protein QP020_02680 [Gallibacterium anatis]|uniref:hypothetical protein n=1 Tax=Gallibacterium anatis TaxID=750 RepID=UPI002550FC72|nr:hypothetical protein [Gallibacterium anatis]WIM84955.1 hypothetical protein QP020_02680 [Gallibacterium anatis]